jgi:steroid delta-isomerase-like uncharacterized protein
MSTEENKATARHYAEELDRRKGAVGADLLAPTYRHYLPGGAGALDSAADQQFHMLFYAAFPDLRVTIEDMIAEGDQVVTRATWRGTHQGEFQGIAPTGKPMTLTGIQILRIRDGKLVEHRSEFDGLGLMQQLGAIPAPGRPA